jgi:hypothetical protein
MVEGKSDGIHFTEVFRTWNSCKETERFEIGSDTGVSSLAGKEGIVLTAKKSFHQHCFRIDCPSWLSTSSLCLSCQSLSSFLLESYSTFVQIPLSVFCETGVTNIDIPWSAAFRGVNFLSCTLKIYLNSICIQTGCWSKPGDLWLFRAVRVILTHIVRRLSVWSIGVHLNLYSNEIPAQQSRRPRAYNISNSTQMISYHFWALPKVFFRSLRDRVLYANATGLEFCSFCKSLEPMIRIETGAFP